jgi:hypothetical protein
VNSGRLKFGHCKEHVVIVWYLDLQLSMQSVPVTSNVVSSNPAQGEVYSIELYVTKFVSDLWQVGACVNDILPFTEVNTIYF